MRHLREELRQIMLEAKFKKGLSWQDISKFLNKSPVYSAMLVYGYGQCDDLEAKLLGELFELNAQQIEILKSAPYREPVQPWPPTDPFVYRFYEIVLLYMPVIKDVAHEIFGDGIMSAIDMSIDLEKVIDEAGNDRMLISFNGKWLRYKKF